MIKKSPCAEILSRRDSEKMGFSVKHELAFRRNGLVVPVAQILIKDNAHSLFEIICDLFAIGIDALQNIYCHFQPLGSFGHGDEFLGNLHRVKYDTLAGARHVRKQSVFNRVVL